MITDALLKVSAEQAVTTDAASDYSIDLGTARDIGEGEELYMYFTVDVAATSDTAGSTVDFKVIGSASEDLSSPVVLGASGPIVKTALTAGKQIAVRINPSIGSKAYQYVGAYYDVSATLTAGKFTAGIVKDIQDGKKFYTSGFSVA